MRKRDRAWWQKAYEFLMDWLFLPKRQALRGESPRSKHIPKFWGSEVRTNTPKINSKSHQTSAPGLWRPRSPGRPVRPSLLLRTLSSPFRLLSPFFAAAFTPFPVVSPSHPSTPPRPRLTVSRVQWFVYLSTDDRAWTEVRLVEFGVILGPVLFLSFRLSVLGKPSVFHWIYIYVFVCGGSCPHKPFTS